MLKFRSPFSDFDYAKWAADLGLEHEREGDIVTLRGPQDRIQKFIDGLGYEPERLA